MKLVTLNIWGAQVTEPFIEFIKNNKDIDIFCLQEVYEKAENKMSLYPTVSQNIFSELQAILTGHRGFFRPVVDGVYGIAIFIKKEIPMLEEGEVLIHKNTQHPESSGHHSRNLQWIRFGSDQKPMTVVNVHGLWNGAGKSDTPERLVQSRNIKAFVEPIPGPKILCGDFNLEPETESLKMLESFGLKNLIKEYGVTSTRTSLYTKPIKFADYVFVSKDVHVKDFNVLPDEVSDHSPLYVEFE